MELTELNKIYFSKGTRGYTIISRYYFKYQDLFRKTIFSDFNDFINQIFLNISGIEFSEEIKNPEAYIIGSIKIQCRVQLDKAIKLKSKTFERIETNEDEDENKPAILKLSSDNNPAGQLDFQEMFLHLNIFKLQLKHTDIALLNFLIDEKQRKEIADEMNLNLNTLDTHIRRLRIKLADYFKKLGYSFQILDKYEK